MRNIVVNCLCTAFAAQIQAGEQKGGNNASLL
jgi:hypothetical protein